MVLPDGTWDATATAAAVGRGECTAAEVVAMSREAIAELDGRVNAVLDTRVGTETRDQQRVSRPSCGVAMLLDDLGAHEKGQPHYSGSRFLRRADWRPTRDAHLVTKLREAGVDLLGRTNTAELGLAPVTAPAATGVTRNPWDPRRSVAGATGGSAAAVATGMAPLAQGSDHAGAVRLSASSCAVFGFKPSRGRVSAGGVGGDSLGLTRADGFFARTVRDLVWFVEAAAGGMPGDISALSPSPLLGSTPTRLPLLRVGVLEGPFDRISVDQARRDAVVAVATLLSDHGHHVEHVEQPGMTDLGWVDALSVVTAASVAMELSCWERSTQGRVAAGDVEPLTWATAEIGRSTSGVQLHRALSELGDLARVVEQGWSTDYDVLVLPTSTHLDDPRKPSTTVRPASPLRGTELTAPFNVTGQPAITVPGPWRVDGEPIGVQIVGAVGRDELVLSVAALLEELLPPLAWPPISVHGSQRS